MTIIDMTPKCRKDTTYADPNRIVYGHWNNPLGQADLNNPYLGVKDHSEMPFDSIVVYLNGKFFRYSYRYMSAQDFYLLTQVATKTVNKNGKLSDRGEYDDRIIAAHRRWLDEGKPEKASFVW